MIALFFFIGFGLGCGWMYAGLRAKYHRGCGNFLGACADLVERDQFNPDTVRVLFQLLMPWQEKVLR